MINGRRNSGQVIFELALLLQRYHFGIQGKPVKTSLYERTGQFCSGNSQTTRARDHHLNARGSYKNKECYFGKLYSDPTRTLHHESCGG